MALARSVLGPVERVAVAAASAVLSFVDPTRADMVATVGETTSLKALEALHSRMEADDVGRRILREQPRMSEDTLDLPTLRSLPEGSFGREYVTWMDAHSFSPDARDTVVFIDDPRLAYVMQRYREVHDFWHVLCGVPPNVMGEVALKWFEMVQTGLPLCALSAFVGPLRLSRDDRKILFRHYVPWAASTAADAEFLMNVPYEDLLPEPLDDVRRQLRVTPAPTP